MPRYRPSLNLCREQIIIQALDDKQELDNSITGNSGYKVADSVRQPDLAALRSKCRKDIEGKCLKPPDARLALKQPGNSLFVEQQSHAALVKETAAKLQAYAKGTPAALEKFRKARERIKREEQAAAESFIDTRKDPNNVGGPGLQRANTAPVASGYDASRDPRLRR